MSTESKLEYLSKNPLFQKWIDEGRSATLSDGEGNTFTLMEFMTLGVVDTLWPLIESSAPPVSILRTAERQLRAIGRTPKTENKMPSAEYNSPRPRTSTLP